MSKALPPRYLLNTKSLQCADSWSSSRVAKRLAGPSNRIVPHDAFGSPLTCAAHSPAINNDTDDLHALVISGSSSCFERAKLQLLRLAGFAHVRWTHAIHDDGGTNKDNKCKDSQLQRTYDGIVGAHRAAWTAVVQSNRSMAVFEEDAELIGDKLDVRAAVRACTSAAACDVSYLGLTGDFFSSHAYYIT